MPNKLSRRSFMSHISAAALAAVVPMPAFALSASSAKSLVDKLVADINRVIDSGKSESAMLKEFERIFDRYADVPTIARYALGVEARRASAAQLREFTQVFQRYISIKYGKRFREFIGGKIVVDSARQIKSFIEVKTTAHLRGEAPFDVTFLVSDKSGQEKFFNLFIEGINMLLTERTEIGAMLDQRGGNIDAMIADLRKAS
ncbi:hopanoid biosynthesis associated membrane protein HpnM [Thalassovita gelatinovora]|uniref:Hopanoid biosynthesis associated membrane protein HpnM n=1 Tax=Thalassovita gelatinovora TaxID=53501 RepID=A0A0P1F5Q2_THAGE|nr:ABC transporter substrate-binding protein [Thalassovita gelatinovora]QIZ80798.1 ABC transporter substrate-binding protein [Thalassovita gelatinovora]CUH63188.1 hopanoid biosynthesis associated membrane protein HpnM [Thalassovita gelatinovora]SEQ63155.1 phospholipid transport system substrate-binding protein [Thalassovita gelatinovora]